MESVVITFRTSEEVKQILDNLALEDNRTLSNIVETIVLRWLEENNKMTQN